MAAPTAPTATAASSAGEQDDAVSLVAEILNFSSATGLPNPLVPAPEQPSNRAGYGLRGSVEVSLSGQGYRIDRGGDVEAQALELAKQGYNGEIWFDAQGVSRPIYLPHGEGIVSRVKQEQVRAISDWYLNATPPRVENPGRAGVETWGESNGDIYIGQFFSYEH